MKRLKIGNSKLSKNIAVFDLPAITTCLNSSLCASTCYAMKAQRQYKQTRAWREENHRLATEQPILLAMSIMSQLDSFKGKYVRIHSSGDFFHQAYINLWATIALVYPQFIFYAYTKVTEILDFSKFMRLKNVVLINSILPNGEVNYADHDTILSYVLKYKLPVCPDTLGHSGTKCGETCTLCMQRSTKGMLFIKH